MDGRLAIALFALVSLSSLNSAMARDGSTYVGLSGGQSNLETSVGIPGNGPLRIDSDQSGHKLYLGRMERYLGVEGGYVNLGTASVRSPVFAELKMDGWDLLGIARLPLGRAGAIFAKGGAISWNTHTSVSGISSGSTGFDFAYGFGASLDISDAISLRAEYEAFEVGSIERVELISAGFTFGF